MEVYKVQYLEKFNEFVSQLITLSSDTTELVNTLNKLILLSDDDKMAQGQLFLSEINSDSEYKKLFQNRKLKLFSSKNNKQNNISNSLLKQVSLKKILNNKEQKIKTIIWDYLHLLYVFSDLSNENEIDSEFNKKLIEQVQQNSTEPTEPTNPTEKYPELFNNIGGNEKTNELIKDVINIFNDSKNKLNETNPIESLMKITKEIEGKYGASLENGEIDVKGLIEKLSDVNPMMKGITKMINLDNLNQQQQEVVIDENFSTDQVKVGTPQESSMPDISGMINMMNQLQNPSDDNPIGKLMSKVTKLQNLDDKDINDKDIEEMNKEIMDLMKDSLGVDPEQLKKMYENLEGQEINENAIDQIQKMINPSNNTLDQEE
jgi:hypothetical protein